MDLIAVHPPSVGIRQYLLLTTFTKDGRPKPASRSHPLKNQDAEPRPPSPIAIGDAVSLDACVDVGLCCDTSG